ncbi:MAG: hypothetical protein WAM79_16590, partial [Candidatus Sulfotelmatobacter sp.]
MQNYRIVGLGEPIESENRLEFHLLYSGPLHSGSSETAKREKHAIRRVFHAQLRRLWETYPNLRERAEGNGDIGITQEEAGRMAKGELFQRGVQRIGENWSRNGYQFVPLVTEKLVLRCRLDILFLRTDEYPFV